MTTISPSKLASSLSSRYDRTQLSELVELLMQKLNEEPAKKEISFHGMSSTRPYSIWATMKSQCYNQANASFERVGAKGIAVCEAWKDNFVAFFTWANENGYAKRTYLRRRDKEADFSPENCYFEQKEISSTPTKADYVKLYNVGDRSKTAVEWARELNITTQAFKRRFSKEGFTAQQIQKGRKILVDFAGEKLTLREVSERLGLPYALVREKHLAGVALHRKYQKNVKYRIGDREMSLKQWSIFSGINYGTLISRVRSGWRATDLLLPVRKNKKTS
jgi:hypothetical protein